jgi:hypothetical protein
MSTTNNQAVVKTLDREELAIALSEFLVQRLTPRVSEKTGNTYYTINGDNREVTLPELGIKGRFEATFMSIAAYVKPTPEMLAAKAAATIEKASQLGIEALREALAKAEAKAAQ